MPADHYAVVTEDGEPLTLIEGTVADAMRSARSMTELAVTYDGPVDEVGGALAANPFAEDEELVQLRVRPEDEPALAYRRSGLVESLRARRRGPDHLVADEVLALSPKDAWRALRPYFPRTRMRGGERVPILRYQTPQGMAESLLGENTKIGKEHPRFPASRAVGLSLVPHRLVHERLRVAGTFCSRSVPQCRATCLVYTGHNAKDPYLMTAKLKRSEALLREPVAFARILLDACRTQTRTRDYVPFIRLNVYSDIPWELFFPELFELVELPRSGSFYDYTKVPGRLTPPNYDLTFSFSGSRSNELHAASEISRGRRVAVVFLSKKGRLPDAFALPGTDALPVIDGDEHDIRPLDPAPVIVGLTYKTPKRRQVTMKLRMLVHELYLGERSKARAVRSANRLLPSGKRLPPAAERWSVAELGSRLIALSDDPSLAHPDVRRQELFVVPVYPVRQPDRSVVLVAAESARQGGAGGFEVTEESA